MLNTFHQSTCHTLFILYSTYTSCATPYLSHTVINTYLVLFKPSLYIMITGTILNFPNTLKIVMQIMAGVGEILQNTNVNKSLVEISLATNCGINS